MTATTDCKSTPGWIRHLLGRAGLWTAFIWGVAEGSLFFLVPDLIITLAAVYAARRSLLHVAAVTAGSLVAGTILFAWSAVNPGMARDAVMGVPFVAERMAADVTGDFEAHGVWALRRGPTSGTPYKVYAITAPRHVAWGPFVLVSIPARLERLVITWAQFALLGIVCRRLFRRRPGWAAAVHAAYWILVYTYYWGTMG